LKLFSGKRPIFAGSDKRCTAAQTAATRNERQLAKPSLLGRSQIGSGMTKRAELYACLYAMEFPAQALLRLRSGLCDKPCVVMAGEPPLERVCSLTRKARILGLLRGMTRVEVDTFSAVTVLPRSHKADTATKAILLECANTFSPRIEEKSECALLPVDSRTCGMITRHRYSMATWY
jgi:hypothetical protein